MLVSLGATLALGYAVKSPCVTGEWNDGRQYTRYCYSDIVPLLGWEQLSGGRLPYLDPCAPSEGNCDEYPVLTMYTMRLAAWVSDEMPGFYFANMAILASGAFVVALCLYLLAGSRALYFTLAPTLVLYAFFNWDLVAVALATAGILAYTKRRDVWSGVLLGLGAAAKLYPALLVVPLVAGRFRGKEPDRGIHLAWAAAGSWLAVNVPFMVWGTGGWWNFFATNSERSANVDSLWYVACERLTGQTCASTQAVNVASFVLFVGLVATAWWAKSGRDPGFPRWSLGFPILVFFLLTNKVYSPQYSLWLLPWFALALPNLRLFIAFELSDVAVFAAEFSWFARVSGFGGVPTGTLEMALVLRAAVLVACVVAWVRGREVEAEPSEPLTLPIRAPA